MQNAIAPEKRLLRWHEAARVYDIIKIHVRVLDVAVGGESVFTGVEEVNLDIQNKVEAYDFGTKDLSRSNAAERKRRASSKEESPPDLSGSQKASIEKNVNRKIVTRYKRWRLLFLDIPSRYPDSGQLLS